jgi:hypothetical protein
VLLLNRPHERHHPTDECPAEKKVQQKNGESIAAAARYGDDSGQEIKNRAEEKSDESEKTAEEEAKNTVDHFVIPPNILG